MPPLDRLLWRLLVASLGFIAAVAASIAVIAATAFLLPALDLAAGDPQAAAAAGVLVGMQRGAHLLPILAQVVWTGWLLAFLLAEIAAIRRLAFHLFVPAVIAAIGVVASIEVPPGALVRLAVAAGLVAGFAHWLVAGRNAGFALRRTQSAAEGDPRPPHA
mgnify:CR=1 FL=1